MSLKPIKLFGLRREWRCLLGFAISGVLGLSTILYSGYFLLSEAFRWNNWVLTH